MRAGRSLFGLLDTMATGTGAARDNQARIISLLPSATEILCALGAADRLVGISHECDYPAEIHGRAVLTRSRIDSQGSSRAIDTAGPSGPLGCIEHLRRRRDAPRRVRP